ncbi:MAG: NifU family protein [Clostridia bacterium]|nr:NifU family protein [Clostridia bacterium]
MKDYIEKVLGPRLQGDGGWVEFVSQEGETVELIFRGECSKCGILDRCCGWMEQMILKNLGQQVKIRAIRRKPYFQDNK